jgi:multidrug resistance efflux pump
LSQALRDSVENLLTGLFGRRRPALKIGSLLALTTLLYLVTAKAEFRIPAKAVVEGAVQIAAVVPFDSYIGTAPIRAGAIVHTGDLLASLDDRDLQLEKMQWETERDKLLEKQREALAKHDRTNIQVIGQEIEQANARLGLVNAKLARTRIAAPIEGVVVSGDLSQMIGAPVNQGKVLFEIAPLDQYRVVLQIDERDIRYVSLGQPGAVTLTGAAARALPFKVANVTSVATADEGRNYFRVEARLDANDPALRPGMEGIGKINAGQGRLLWTWTRPLLERTQLLIWALTP